MKKKYKIAVLILIFGISLIIGYKKYLNNNQEEPILAFYNSDTNGWLDDIPKKGSNLIFEKAECDNDATVEWDEDKWAPKVLNLKTSKVRCTLYFGIPMNNISTCGKGGTNATTCIKNEASNDTTNLANDNTSDKNIRYIGTSPNNYVRFNNELWRIIGVMNNIKTSANGAGESRLKIIKNASIGNIKWDNTNSNNWARPASLNTTLQARSEANSSLVDNAVWNIGGFYMRGDYYYEGEGMDPAEFKTSVFYTAERGTNTYNNQPSTWTGKVGLMYPSDYGFAVGGSVRDDCLNSSLPEYYMYGCNGYDWLYDRKIKWTLTHNIYYVVYDGVPGQEVFEFDYDSMLSSSPASYIFESEVTPPAVFPVVYLKSSVKIISGFGTSDNPYELSL